jgi:hypothetical protein
MWRIHMRNTSGDGCLDGKVRSITAVLKAYAVFACLAGLILALTLPVAAQTTSGQIAGTVSDPNGAAVAGTTVTATQVGTGLQRTATTSSDGNYSFPELPIGIYRLSVNHQGFKGAVIENVTVNIATTTRQEITLEVGAATEQVTITADSVQVQTESGALSS